MNLEELRARSGQEVGVSGWHTVTQDQINRFAEVTGDHQWIHVDVGRARHESPHQSTIAHGFLTVSLISALLREAVQITGDYKMRINYGFNRLRFPAGVLTGSRIRARFTVNSMKDIEGGVEIAWGVVIEIENREKPALVAEWLVRTYY